MELREGYKQTEVGVIPEDWDVKNLGEVAAFLNGKAHEQCIDDMGDYIVVNSKFISTQGKVAKNSNQCISPLNNGDIVMVMSDIPNGKALARCYTIPKDDRYTLNQRICSVRSKIVDNNFLALILNRNEYYLSFDSGTGQTNLRRQDVLDCPLPLPPTKTEQTAIANALSDVDAWIQSLTRLIAKKRQIKQGAMQTLLNPYENGHLKVGWVVKTLKDVLRIGHGKSQHEVIDGDGDYPILASGGEIGRANKYLYDKPSVLIGRKGTIDVPQYMDKPFWTIDTLFYTEVFEPNNAKYLFYQFNLIDWYLYNEASGVPSLSARTIENIEIIVPLPDEQNTIATILSDMDTEIATLETKLKKAQQIKQGMMQNLLTGRIRLVPPQKASH